MILNKSITSPIKSFFKLLGLDVKVYISKTSPKATGTLNIGKYSLAISQNNPLLQTFKDFPLYSGELNRLVKAVIQKYPNLNAIDIGANIGDTLALIKTGADIPVICIEGDKFCFGFLEMNSKQFKEVRLFNKFFGEHSKSIEANLTKEGWNTTIIPNTSKESTKIDLISMDDFFREEEIKTDNLKILKIDTEGFDLMIIRGGMEYISNVKPVLYIEYNRENMSKIGENGLKTLINLIDIGYDSILVYDPFGRFLLSDSLKNTKLITQLHNYIDGQNSRLPYFDLCIFHTQDKDLATSFIKTEEAFIAKI